MNTLTAVQYKSELNSFVKFVYDTYGCDVDSLIGMIMKMVRAKRRQILIRMMYCQDILPF